MCNNINEELINIQTGEKLDWDRVNELKDNAMLKVKPDLWIEWDFEKNEKLGLDIWKMTKRSNKRIHWICSNNPIEHSWIVAIGHRAGNNSGCPYCSGRKATTQNNLLTRYPEISSEWDYDKNKNTPEMYTPKSNESVWWRCKNGHSYPQTIKHRANGGECIYCTNRALLVGFNDLSTTNPCLARLLFDEKDGQKYMQFSNHKIDWKCSSCGMKIKNKKISDVNIYGLSCFMCSDGIKYPERVMRSVLKQLNIRFEHEKTFIWSESKRFDFYLVEKNVLIECHGGQHFNGGFSTQGGKTLEEEILNDKYKKGLALKNNISQYIVIDSRISDLTYIKTSILTSMLNTLFDLSVIDWIKVEKEAQKSISHECLLLWNEGMRDIAKISDELKIHKEMVRRYLIKWSKVNKCDFNISQKTKRKIVQLSMELNFIKEWESIRAASDSYDDNSRRNKINSCLIGSSNEAYGFKWMYKQDYEKYLTDKTIPEYIPHESHQKRSVVKLNSNLELLDAYDSITEAALKNDIKSFGHITSCCKGKRNSAGGFKWMYKEDYNRMVQQQNIN